MHDLLIPFGFSKSLNFYGFGEENDLLQFLLRAHERGLDITICHPNFFRKLGRRPSFFSSWTDLAVRSHVEKEFYYDPSLYRRTQEEFEYAVMVLETISEPEYAEVMLPDIPYEPERFMAMMLDENGNIKPSGLGGPKKGKWGDTIWNTVEEMFSGAEA